MDSKLIEVWQTAAGNPFLPTIDKDTQFLVAFVLLLLGLSAFGIFALSKSMDPHRFMVALPLAHLFQELTKTPVLQTDPSLPYPSLASPPRWLSRTFLPYLSYPALL